MQAYLNLSKERVGLVSESDRLEVFKELTKHYEPLALGNVNRVYMETRVIAREVLSLHMDSEKDAEQMDRIVKALTETYTHEFLITRDIAEKIGLKVVRPKQEEENLIMKLYESYEDEMKMNIPFDAEALLSSVTPTQQPPQVGQASQPQTPQPLTPQSNAVKFKIKLGAIESMSDSFIWVTDGSVHPPAPIQMIAPQMPTAQASALAPTVVFKLCP